MSIEDNSGYTFNKFTADSDIKDIAIGAAGLGVWTLNTITNTVTCNENCFRLLGLPGDFKLSVQNLLEQVHQDDIVKVNETIQEALKQKNGDHTDVTLRINSTGNDQIRYINFRFAKIHEDQSGSGIFSGIAIDVTKDTILRTRAEQNEHHFRRLIHLAPFAMAVYKSRELVIEMANTSMIRVWGKNPSVVGMKLSDALPELEGQPFLGLLEQVFDTGIAYRTNEQQVSLFVDGRLQNFWFNFIYDPLTDQDGNVYAILNMAVDVTERVMVRQRIEESRQLLLASFEQAPVAIATLSADNLVFTMSNTFYAELVGRTPDQLIGKSLLDAMPELKDQGFEELLMKVVATGIPYNAIETPVDIVRNNQLETIYVDLNYQPLRESDGRIYSILVVATHVTQQVIARKQIEASEARLKGAIELAQLATWSLDIRTNTFTYSPRFMEWLGFSEETKSLDEAYNPLPAEFRDSVRDAISNVILPGSTGFYENEHPVINRITGQIRIIHAQAQVFYDNEGNPAVLSGTAQDVTDLKKYQQELEQQVQIRTEELEATNEELAATNEELAATNEEFAATNEDLAEANNMLVRSNKNLEQFAYVASHDLQEPLRKIKQFGDLLKMQYNAPSAQALMYLERMQSAAGRMSVLIEDLLTFARISTQQEETELVVLDEILSSVLSDLDLRIQETGAVIETSPLPAIPGDKVQMGQLFQNLLSNALKFRSQDITPHIQITSDITEYKALADSVKPTRWSAYYHVIRVSDNGIGFDQKYADRIFQVFQRLHGKSEFAGTGIGLAICEKVVSNHGGAIAANGKPGEGATFIVYLPAVYDKNQSRINGKIYSDN